ncbi:uncharacterized protein LY79DRAFT_543134 [Colletotrichum navitas]|uniref:Uncharacterized protein n=1 Tax=Colletotrichum navitas TaxID=681940 RepID=A0AAD8Q8A0_9PEZI|nr:uncharacterized protein LY79DRAFT_543134 [Colletotrichum navitas]KAK1596907.1 hypothetical protein LY79DRAFT_543134 [Colletotrichum navitas]
MSGAPDGVYYAIMTAEGSERLAGALTAARWRQDHSSSTALRGLGHPSHWCGRDRDPSRKQQRAFIRGQGYHERSLWMYGCYARIVRRNEAGGGQYDILYARYAMEIFQRLREQSDESWLPPANRCSHAVPDTLSDFFILFYFFTDRVAVLSCTGRTRTMRAGFPRPTDAVMRHHTYFRPFLFYFILSRASGARDERG